MVEYKEKYGDLLEVNMKRQSKSKVYYPNLALVIIGITVIAFSAYSIISLGLLKNTKVSVLNSLENEYYVVGKEPTTYQKELFEELTKKLYEKDQDYKEISELVAKSFVVDFFGWSNKDSSFDIGGLQYMRDPETFSNLSHWEFYQKLDVFNSTYGSGKLPKVRDIIATTKQINDYKVEDDYFDAYQVDLKWSYDFSANLNIGEFVNSSEITLIEDQGKVVIVEIKMVDEVNEDE